MLKKTDIYLIYYTTALIKHKDDIYLLISIVGIFMYASFGWFSAITFLIRRNDDLLGHKAHLKKRASFDTNDLNIKSINVMLKVSLSIILLQLWYIFWNYQPIWIYINYFFSRFIFFRQRKKRYFFKTHAQFL